MEKEEDQSQKTIFERALFKIFLSLMDGEKINGGQLA